MTAVKQEQRSRPVVLERAGIALAVLTWTAALATAPATGTAPTSTMDPIARIAGEGSACGRPVATLAPPARRRRPHRRRHHHHAADARARRPRHRHTHAHTHTHTHSHGRSRNPFANRSLRAYLGSRAGETAAAVYDMTTGATYLYRPDLRDETASIVKVDILATLLHERQGRGGLSPGEEATAQRMIEQSDNTAATALWNEAGGAPAVAAFNARAGLPQTTPSSAWGLTTTSARDQLELLRCVTLPNPLLDLRSRENEYELMRHVTPSQHWGISAGAGAGASVALKNGWLPISRSGWQVNSIGSVVGSGRSYLIAVLTGHQPTEGYGIATIEAVSAATWRTLAPPARPSRRRHHRH
jgi:beta-lactamase class A